MDEETIQNLRARADAKLSYAEIHLDELKAMGKLGGSTFDRAHQESFLFHLLGAKEAFLIELNTYYCGGLPGSALTSGKLRAALKGQGKTSAELSELYTLENDESSWLFHAKEMRDHPKKRSCLYTNLLRVRQAIGSITLRGVTRWVNQN